MFQNNRPALSNRFQSASSRTSARSSAIPAVTLRTPLSNSERSFAAAAVCQQAHSGSGPDVECGKTTCALLVPARSQRRASHSRVRNGMSQLRIRFHSGRAAVRPASSSAVMIPPSGPSPGQRSSTVVTPNAVYLFAAATILTSFVTCRSSSIMRFSIGVPPTSTSALSRPNRVLPPPTKTYPTTSVSVFPAVILQLSVSFLFLAFSALPVVSVSIFILLPRVLCLACGFPARAVSLANSAGAIRWSPRFGRRSSDARSVAWSGRPLQIFAWPPGNPVRRYRCPARRPDASSKPSRRAPPQQANPRHQFRFREKARRSAPAHSSTPAHCPASHISRSLPILPASAAPSAPVALHATAKTLPPATEYPLCEHATPAAQWSPRAAGKTSPRETFRRGSPRPNCGAWR